MSAQPVPPDPAALTLCLLGAPRVARGGQEIPLALRKAWCLIAYLALEGRGTRERLAGLLWPELDQAAARRNLRRELHRLREAGLGALIGGDGSTLAFGAVDTDVTAYLRALDDGRVADAVACYRGALIDGVQAGGDEFDGWLQQRRDQLHSRWQQAARAHAESLQARGDLPAALAVTLRVLDVDALQEADYRSAMQLHDRLGDREAALALYERCRKALGRELGLRPMAETVALAERLRRGERGMPAGPAAVAALATGDDDPLLPRAPLVGREPALDRLAAWAGGASAAPPAFVWITGPAGVGKTRLAREHAVRHGGLCHHGARPGDALVAYAAPARWLRERGASAATLPAPLQRELSRVLPELDFGGPPPDPASPRDRLFDALAQAWTALAPDDGAVDVFDDLQWLDPSGFDWLLFLLTRRGSTVPALCLARGDELDEAAAARVRALAAAGSARLLALAPLADVDTLALVRRLSGSQQGERFARRLHQATGGHPLFLLETLRHLLASGWIGVDAQGQWHTPVDDTTQDYAELPVPASVREAVLARVERLDEAPRRLIDAASCLGRPLRFAVIARATALSEWEGVAAFERLRAAQLMDTDADGLHRFAHDLIATTVADALPPERRRLLHRALAQTLAQADPRDEAAADIARHWEHGGEPAMAQPWWARAAAQAEALGAPAEALALADRALQRATEPVRVTQLQMQRARLHLRLAQTADQLAALDLADRAARTSGDATLTAQVQLRRASAIATTDLASAEAMVDAVLLQRDLPALVRSAALQQQAVMRRMRGDLQGCLEACDVALKLLPPGEWHSRTELTMLRGFALMFAGRGAEAEEQMRRGIDAARASGNDRSQVQGLCALASLVADRGDPSDSRRLCEEALTVARGTHSVGTQRVAYLNLVRALAAQGAVEEALSAIQQAADLSAHFSSLSEEQAIAEARFVLALMAGELGRALDAAPALLDVSRRAGEQYRALSGLLAPTEAWLQLDSQRDEAARLLDEVEQRLGDSEIVQMRQAAAVRRAELMLRQGNADAALALVDAALADPSLRTQDHAHALRLRALARHALGQPARLDAPAPDVNPEVVTLIAAARLRLDVSTLDDALAWFHGGRATPLEALQLALALQEALPAARSADRTRLSESAGALARRLHASLAGHETAQTRFRRQFAPLF